MMILRSSLFILLLLQYASQAQNSARFFCPKGELFRVKSNTLYVNTHPQAEVLVAQAASDTLQLSLEQESGKTAEVTVYLTDKGKKVSGKEFDFIVDFS